MADQLHGEQSNQDICQEAVLSCAVSASRLVANALIGPDARARGSTFVDWSKRALGARTGRSP